VTGHADIADPSLFLAAQQAFYGLLSPLVPLGLCVDHKEHPDFHVAVADTFQDTLKATLAIVQIGVAVGIPPTGGKNELVSVGSEHWTKVVPKKSASLWGSLDNKSM